MEERAAADTRLQDAMAHLYGAVAAILRSDTEGMELMLGDLRRGFRTVTEVLVTVSLVTLDQMRVTFEQSADLPSPPPSPEELITLAISFGTTPAASVHAAAWRLDAVRCRDAGKARRDVRGSRAAGSDGDLVAGAVALLAAVVAAGAIRRGAVVSVVARDLCMAAALERVS